MDMTGDAPHHSTFRPGTSALVLAITVASLLAVSETDDAAADERWTTLVRNDVGIGFERSRLGALRTHEGSRR